MAILREHHPITVPLGPGRLGRPTARPRVARPPTSPSTEGWVAPPLALPRPVERALRGLVRVVAPFEHGPVMADGERRVEEQARVLMQYLPRVMQIGLCVVFVALDWAPVLLLRSTRRLRTLAVEDHARAVALFEELMRSRWTLVRHALFGVRGVVLPAYYDQPEVHFALGYHPDRWINERIAVRRRLMSGGAPDAADMIHPLDAELHA